MCRPHMTSIFIFGPAKLRDKGSRLLLHMELVGAGDMDRAWHARMSSNRPSCVDRHVCLLGNASALKASVSPVFFRWRHLLFGDRILHPRYISADISCCNVPLVSFQINFLIINRESNKAWSREIQQKEKDKKKKPKWNSTVELPIKTQTIQYKRPQTIHRYSQVLPQLHLMPPLDWPFHKRKKRSDNKHT